MNYSSLEVLQKFELTNAGLVISDFGDVSQPFQVLSQNRIIGHMI